MNASISEVHIMRDWTIPPPLPV